MWEAFILALDSLHPSQWSTSVIQPPKAQNQSSADAQVTDLGAARAKKRAEAIAKTKSTEAEMRELLAAQKIDFPVRIRMAEQPDTDKPAESEEIQHIGNGVYLYRDLATSRFQKIQKLPEMWTCSCAKWKKQRKIDCQHIDKVRAWREGRSMPYATARRRPATRIFYAEGTPSESTRRKKAYESMPQRCPEIFEELCRQINEPVIASSKGGAPPIPLACRAYAFLIKVQFRFTYAELSNYLLSDRAMQRLAWMKATPLGQSTLSAICADPRLADEFKRMIYATAHTAHRIESVGIIDASGLPNSLAANYNEDKHGKRRKRKGRTYLKPHWVSGRDTNLIAFVEFTLDYGLGSGDAPHYRRAAIETKRVWPLLKEMLGDAAYGAKGNIEASSRLGIEFITREKRHENRKDWGGKAAEIADLQHNRPKEFNEHYRFRSRGETPPARIKGHQSYQRLRRRVHDTVLPKDASEEDRILCELPDNELFEIIDFACSAPGRAQVNEAHAQIVAGNVREMVMMEHLHDERVSLAAGGAFTPIPIILEDDLRAS